MLPSKCVEFSVDSGLTQECQFSAHVQGVSWSPNGQRLAVFGGDTQLAIFDWEDQQLTQRVVMKGHQSTVMDGEFTLDGSILATASVDGTARLWG